MDTIDLFSIVMSSLYSDGNEQNRLGKATAVLPCVTLSDTLSGIVLCKNTGSKELLRICVLFPVDQLAHYEPFV